jgi:hypothetical protein
MNKSKTLAKIESFARQELKLLLDQCTPDQHLVFKRMYAHQDISITTDQAVDNMPYDKINWAIQQAERSVEENNNKHNK